MFIYRDDTHYSRLVFWVRDILIAQKFKLKHSSLSIRKSNFVGKDTRSSSHTGVKHEVV